MSATDYWQEHQVGGPYTTLEASNDALDKRRELYPDLYDLMPVQFPGKTVLDYGCGPGHDTVMFALNGAEHVYAYDVSLLALETTAARLYLYGLSEKVTYADPSKFPRVDHVHCAGVLHHMRDPITALRQMRRALRSGGTGRVMVYDGDRSQRSQSDVPITHWWGEQEFTEIAAAGGFDASYVGGYECSAPWRPNCYAACYSLC